LDHKIVHLVGTSGSYSFGHKKKFESTSKVASRRPSGWPEEAFGHPSMSELFSKRKPQELGVRIDV